MTTATLNKPVPAFELPATSNKTISLADLQGKNVVIFFYPKDSTPGCTREGQDFRDMHDQFEALNTVILGVSRDSLKSHENFKCKQEFPFELLSDKEEVLCKLFDVIKEKNMYGKKFMGIVRSTFVLNQKGEVVAEWRKVKVPGHVEEVLQTVTKL